MGKYKLRLWDMMPNAWFYKLKDMGGKARDSSSSINASSNSPNKKQPKPKPLPLPAATSHPSNPKQSPHSPYPRKSYYFSRELIPNHNNTLLNLPDPPRRPSKHRARRRASSPKLISSSGCSCRTTPWTNNSKSDNFPLSRPDHEGAIIFPEEAESFEPFLFPPEFRSDGVLATQSFDQMLSAASKSCACQHETDVTSCDTIIDVDNKSLARKTEKQLNPLDNVSQLLDLPPIVTKQVTKSDDKKEEDTKEKQKDNSKELHLKNKRTRSSAAKVVKVDQHKSRSNSPGGRRHCNYSANSPGIRLRINSPRIASRRSFHHHKVQGRKSLSLSSSSGSSKSSSTSSSSRRSLLSSLAIVKSSFDPQRDFRESMVEMIVENNISASKDLEDLLACYLSLNSDVYHDLIIKVFKQIWFDLTHVD